MSERTTVWWVRHGPTHEKAFTGWRDVPADLSDAAQIARLRAHLPDDALVVSSDLDRAIRTADAIQDRCRRLPHAADLREFDFGRWDGLRFDQVAMRDPDLSRRYWETPGTVCAPDGESWDMAAARVSARIDTLCADHAGRHIIAVAHFGAILTQVARAKRQTPSQALAQTIDPLSVTRLMFDGQWSAGPVNHIP